MKSAPWLILALGLSACSSAGDQGNLGTILSIASQNRIFSGGRGTDSDPAEDARLRAALEADGQPAIRVGAADMPASTVMVPYYAPHDGAQTWVSLAVQSVTLRDGMLTQTRGLGKDIIASQTPDAAQVARASGEALRIYERLDGGDQVVREMYDCSFAAAGEEDIAILGRGYHTRKVVETCTGPDLRFTNLYWVESGGKIRQSAQYLAKGRAPLQIQRIID